MKKSLSIIIWVCLALFISSTTYATEIYYLKGREISAGHSTSDGVAGATFVGNIFNNPSDEAGDSVGLFTLILGHNGSGIEVCGEPTQLISFKLVMNFFPFGRLVLVKPTDVPASASWVWDDPSCVNGNCILLGYEYFLDPVTPDPPLIDCDDESYDDNDPEAAYIAEVEPFSVVKQRFGSWGPLSRGVTEGLVSGFLDHTPYISPAIVGVVDLY